MIKNYDEFMKALDERMERKIEEIIVECTDCGCLLFKGRARMVKINGATLNFCGKCKPSYDEVYLLNGASMSFGYTKDTYFKNRVEVDKKGKPI